MTIFKRLRKQIAVVLLLLFFTNMAQAADYSWQSLTSINTASSFSGTYSTITMSSDGTKRAVVCDNKYLYISRDSGGSWTEVPLANTSSIISVAMSNNGNRIAVIDIGHVYSSTDGGLTWITQNVSGSFRSLAVSGDGSKLIVGGGIGYLYTSSDWLNWTTHTAPGQRDWQSVGMNFDGSKIIAGSGWSPSGYIYTSTDSGATWIERTSAGNKQWISVGISGDGSKMAAAAYNERIYISTDNGENWVEQTNSGTMASTQKNIALNNDGSVIAMYRGFTTNGGTNWTTFVGHSALTYSVAVSMDGTKLCSVGQSKFMYSSNSGSSWSELKNITMKREWKVIRSSNDGRLLFAGHKAGTLLRSTDSGVTWLDTGLYYGDNSSVCISDDNQKVLAISSNYIKVSTDGGASWTNLTALGNKNWKSLSMSGDGQKIVAAVYYGFIYTSSDGGSTWVTHFSDTNRGWFTSDISNDGSKIVVAIYGGYSYISTNGGSSWTEQTSIGSHSWYNTTMNRDGNKIALLGNGLLYISTDSGSTWRSAKPVSSGAWCASAIKNDGGMLLVAGGAITDSKTNIYLSTDDGMSWIEQTSAGQRAWSSLSMNAGGTKFFAVEKFGQVYTCNLDSGSSTAAGYSFARNGDEVTYTASKSGSAFGSIKMRESKIGIGSMSQSNFSDVVMNITPAGKPNLIIPAATNAIAATVNADVANNAVVTASFTGLPKQKTGRVPPIIMNGVQISDSKGNVFPAYTGYVRNISWDNATGTLTFGITHFTEYGVPVLIGKTFAGTAANAALNTNGTNINVAYTGGSITGTADHDRTVTVKKISGLSYETVLTDVPATVNNLYRPLVPGVTYNISFEYINRGNATDQFDLATAIERANAGHFTVDGNQSKNVAPWQVASFNVEIDADNALAYERATVDVTIDINGETPVSYNGFSDAYQGGTFASDGRYGGADNLSHRFVLEAQGYDLTILSRGVTVNAPAGYTGTPVSETNLVPGATIKYSIAVRNNNYAVATSINITDVIPNACHLYYTDLPSVEGAQGWAWRGATDNMATGATNEAVKFEITIPARATVTASYTITLD